MDELTNRTYEFGPFRLNARQRRLWRDGQLLTLAPKAVDTLLVLAERPWEKISRDELMKRVWPDTFVEDSNLTVAISQLRKVLESSGEAEYIETIPRTGYRLVADVRIVDEALTRTEPDLTPAVELQPAVAVPVSATARPSIRPRIWAVTAVAALGIVALATVVYPALTTRASAPPAIKSLAVLPPYSLNAGTDDKAIRLGLADAMITSLGGVPDLRVLATGAISAAVDDPREPLEIGRALGVDAVVSGTIHQSAGRFRVTLRLLRTGDGSQMWTGTFDEAEADLFRLEDEIARQTRQALTLQLRRSATRPPTQNLEAYHLYLQGQYLFRRRLGKSSVPFFKQAVALDPRFARAWADLAAVYAMGEAMGEAQITVNKSLELEPDLAEAHAVRGFIKMFLDFDWDEAERSLNQAIALDPASVEAHHWLGVYFGIRGRFSEGKAAIERALELDPTSDNLVADLGQIYYFAHDYERAEALYKRADAIDPRLHKNRLIDLYERQGRDREAYELRLVNDCKDYQGRMQEECAEHTRLAFEAGDRRERARVALAGSLQMIASHTLSPNDLAQQWVGAGVNQLQLGQTAKAAECFNRALDTRDRFGGINFYLPFVGVDPGLDELRSEPGFREVLRRLKLQP